MGKYMKKFKDSVVGGVKAIDRKMDRKNPAQNRRSGT